MLSVLLQEMPETFEAHASPEAIRARLDQVRARVNEAQRELMWLEGLFIRRAQEIAMGEWPRGGPLNSACANGLHDRCTGDTYVGHVDGEPFRPPCACACHSSRSDR